MLGGGDGTPGIIDRPHLMNEPLCQKSCWAEIHRLFRCSNIPQRVNTADRLFGFFFGEARFVARPLGLRSTARELNDKPVIAAHDSRSRSATGYVCRKRVELDKPGPKSIASVARKTQKILHEAMEGGKGLVSATPCRNCLRRKKTCWLHLDDKLGKCIDCMSGVVGEMKVRDCTRSRGVRDEKFASRPYHPYAAASLKKRALVGGM